MDVLSRRELFKKYSYDLINTDDIDELQNIFDYASGIIVKDSSLADKYETKVSAKNANTYLKACYKQDNYNDTQREKLKEMYEETNKYYAWLLHDYNIDPLYSRTANDYEILTSITKDNNGQSVLTNWQEELFIRCYNEALSYWNNVTRTKSFQNEEMYRGFSEVYLLFVAIQRYITARMKHQFDVDTFNKFQCKNYFISNGVNYFDDLPLMYQRRLIKLLNDLQRNKGDDNIFEYIKEVLATNNINIYKYVLTKYQATEDNPKGDLKFYKVPYSEELNVYTNEEYSFEEITENDPYWRASKDEVLYQNFNTLDTKYISLEYVVDLIKNSKALSYFMYLLNDSMLKDREDGLNTSLIFYDNNISDKSIKLYDAMIALYSLFYSYIKNDDFSDELKSKDIIDYTGDGYYLKNGIKTEIDDDFERKNTLVVNIYGYANYIANDEINELISDINNDIDNILQRMDLSNDHDDEGFELSTAWYKNLKNFLNNKFNLKSFDYSDNYTFETIEYFYNNPSKLFKNTNISNSNISIKKEFLELANYIRVAKIYNSSEYRNYLDSVNGFYDYDHNYHKPFSLYYAVLNDDLKDALDYLVKLLLNQDLKLEFLSIYPGLKVILKKYVTYCIINGLLKTSNSVPTNPDGDHTEDCKKYNSTYDLFYNFLIYNDVLFDEFVKYSNENYGYDLEYLNEFISNRYLSIGLNMFIKFINIVKYDFFTSNNLYKYRNLLVYLEIFSAFKSELYNKNAADSIAVTGKTNRKSTMSNTDISLFMDTFNKNEAIRSELERYIAECPERNIYNKLKTLWNMKFKADFNFDLYSEFDTFKDYLLRNDENLYYYVRKIGNFNNEVDRRNEVETRILDLATAIENYISSNGNIIYNSTFNIIMNNIKYYAELLIKVFKAYTLDTIYSSNALEFNDYMNDRIKMFDELGEIEDFELEAKPEYIDLHDDIRKDNGELDTSYNLLIRNLIKNDLEDVDPDIDEQKYLEYIKGYFYIYESNNNLPYAFTDLDPTSFESYYGSTVIEDPLDIIESKYNYITESYEWFKDLFIGFVEINSIYKVVISYIEDISQSVVATNDIFDIKYQITDESYLNTISEYDKRRNNGFIKADNSATGSYYIYTYTSAGSVYGFEKEDIDTYLSNQSANYYKLGILNRNSVGINDPLAENSTAQDKELRVYTLLAYNPDTDQFENVDGTKYGYNGNIILKNNRTFLARNYLAEHEMPEGDFNIYFDPCMTSGYANHTYYIYPLSNTSYIPGTLIPGMMKLKWNYRNADDNDDIYKRPYDNRRESLFYLREFRDYNYYPLNRICYNKKITQEIVTVPDIDYLKDLNTNIADDPEVELKNHINGDYIYNTYDDTNTFYVPVENGITDTYQIKIKENEELESTTLSNLRTIEVKGNRFKTLELEFDKYYYIIAEYKYSDIIKMYQELYPTITIPTITIYHSLNSSQLDELKELIGNNFEVEYSGSSITFKPTGIVLTAYIDDDVLDFTLELFDKVGCSRNDSKGYSSDNKFTTVNQVYDEMYKYICYFVVNNSNYTSNIYKYNHSVSTTNKLVLLGYGFGNNPYYSPSNILYEPLRYYPYEGFNDRLLFDKSKDENLPYANGMIEDAELEPNPVLKYEYGYPSEQTEPDYQDFLQVFHKNYTTQQLNDYSVMNSRGSSNGGTDNIFTCFKSIYKVSQTNDSVTFRNEDGTTFTLTNEIISKLPYGMYSEMTTSLLTGLSVLSNDKKPIKTPETLYNSAYMLTLYNSIEN